MYPTTPQSHYIDDTIRACWWFYRYVLHHYEDDYKTAKKNYSDEVLCWYNQNAAYHPNWLKVPLTKLKIPKEFYPLGSPLRHQGFGIFSTYKILQKAREERPYLKNIPAVVMQEVLERVAHAFNKFWKDGSGYPNYPKERNYSSVTWTSGIKLYPENNLLKLSRIPGLLKLVYHRSIKGTIKRANISRDILGQYYVSLMCEYEEEVPVSAGETIVGVDMNIKAITETTRSFIALSTGEKIDIPRWFTEYEKLLAKFQKALAKTVTGTPEWHKQNRKIKHLYEKIQNKKDNWLHNLTHRLFTEFGYVAIEDLNLTTFHKKRGDPKGIDNMQLAGERGQRKAWTETPFGEFKRQLTYKLGNRLIKVDPAYTSQMCSSCKYLNDGLTLDQREWICPKCGIVHDRDVNAAINIKNLGLAFISNSIKNKEEIVT